MNEQSLEEVPTEGDEGIQDVSGEIQNAEGGEDPAGKESGSGEEGVTDTASEFSDTSGEETSSQEDYASYPVLTQGEEVAVRITEEEPVKWYRFTPETSGLYVLTSTGNCDTRASIYEDPQGEALRENDDASGSDANFALRYALEAGKTYYYAVQMYGSARGSFDIRMSYEGAAVTEARIAFYPQRVYYQELSSPDDGGVGYDGLILDVVYTDGSTGYVRYGYDSGLTIENNVKTKTLGTGERVYVPGTYQVSVTYGEYALEYEIQVRESLEEMPELPLDEVVATTVPEYCEYYQVTPTEDGEYAIQTACRDENNSYCRMELWDENGVVAPVRKGERAGVPNLALGVYSLKAGRTYHIVKEFYLYYFRSDDNVPTESSIRISKISSMTEGEELTGTEPGYYVRSFVPGVTGVYKAVQRYSAEGTGPYEVKVMDLSGNLVQTSFGGYEDGNAYVQVAELTEGETYLLYYPYVENEAVSTVSLELQTKEDGLLEEGSAFSLTGTGKDQFAYVRPEQTGICCLELELENGSSQEGRDLLEWNDWERYYGSGLKNEGKSYCEVVRLSEDRIYTVHVYSNSIPEGERGSLKLTRIPDVTGLEIIQAPKTAYEEGEVFDDTLEGLVVRITYEDASMEELAYGQASERTGLPLNFDRGSIPGYEPLGMGKYTGQITYLDQSASLTIRVSGTASEDMGVLELDGDYDIEIPGYGDASWYSFTPESAGMYTVYSYDLDGDAYVELYESVGSAASPLASDDDSEGGYNFRLSYHLKAGETYYYRFRTHGGNTGTYKIHFQDDTPAYSEMVAGLDYDVTISDDGEEAWYRFTPETSGRYVIYSHSKSDDFIHPSVWLYENSLSSWVSYDEGYYDGSYEDGFRLGYEFVAGETYYVRTSSYAGSYKMCVQAAPETRSVTAADLSQTYYEHMETPIDYSELVVEITYEDGTMETLADGRRSPHTGKGFTVTEPKGMRKDGRLNAGIHTLRVSYDGKEGTFSIVVKGAGELEPFTESLTGAAADFRGGARRLTVESDGWYTLQTKYRGMDLKASVYDGAGNRKSPLNQASVYRDDYRYESQILELKAEETYLLMLEGAGDQAVEGDYTVLLRAAKPLTLDMEQEGTLSEDFTLFTFTPSQSGSYTFSATVIGRNYGNVSDIFVYDKGTSIGNGGREWVYDQELNAYRVSYSGGAVLTAGKEYLVRLSYPASDDVGASYTLGVSFAREVSSLRLLKFPKQVYYYKLDPLTRETDLGQGTSIKVSYTDGMEETLFYPSASTVSGQRYTLSMPEDTKYSGSGYVLAGTWNAQLTYLNETISVPVQVKTVGAMPSMEFDESGQGSYSGMSEEADGSGYVRFVAPADGFYNMTLGAEEDPDVRFLGIFNGAYEKYQYTVQSVPSGDRTLVNASVYVRGGQPCYVKYQRSGAGKVSLSVEGVYDKVITELTLGEEKTVSIEKSNEEKWFSFTPSSSGTYYLNGRDAGSWIQADLYLSPEDPESQESTGNYYNYYTNGYDIRLSYDLTAGKTYYYKTKYNYPSDTGTYQIILVKEAKAKSLELLTEGQVYCSSLSAFVDNSFSNLEFLITYEDDTTETMTFGYKGRAERAYSLQGKQIDYDPLSLPEMSDQPIGEEKITVNFRFDDVGCEVSDVMLCSISGLEETTGEVQADMWAGAYQYYRYAPKEAGYYRVTASGASSYPSVAMFSRYMQAIEPLYANSYQEGGAYHQVCVYYLEEITETEMVDGYCLRLGNSSAGDMRVSCTLGKLSPVSNLEVSSKPQMNYYLGVDSAFDPSGLAIQVTYENGDEETLAYKGSSTVTGLGMEVKMGGGSDDSLYLGSSGDKSVWISYMGMETMLTIHVKDASEALEMTDTEAASGNIETERDYAYVQYTPAKSGFYDLMLTGVEGTVPDIAYIKNASYKEVENFDYKIGDSLYDSSLTVSDGRSTRHCLVYLLEGKTYYMKGSLSKDGSSVPGSYEASAKLLDDLRDAGYDGTLGGGKIAAYQITSWAGGDYQLTLQGVEKGAVRIFSSGFRPVSVTDGEEAGQKYAAVKLQGGNTYFVACVNQGSGVATYSVQADKKPEVTRLEASETVYGYGKDESYLEVEAEVEAPEGVEYQLSYEWYDAKGGEPIGKGSRYMVPTGLLAGKYRYYCVAIATRTGGGIEVRTQYQDAVLTVSPRPVELRWSGDVGLIYHGAPVDVMAEVVNLVEGDTCAVKVEGGNAVDAGSYEASVQSVDNPNYTLPANPEDHVHPYTIAPKTVELTWSGDVDLVYNGEAVNVTAEVGNLVEGDTCTVTVEDGDAVDAGSYTATAASVDNSNYALSANPEDHVHPYTIAPRTVELTWSGDEGLVYNGKPVNVKAEVGNLVVGDICTVTVKDGDAVNAGSYTATAASVDNSNYALSANPEDNVHPYTIAPRTVELTWSGDKDLVYNGKPVNVTAEVGNLVEGDTCTVTVKDGDAVNAGSYTATAASVDNANYILSANPEDHVHPYTIAPRTVELTWSGDEGLVYNGKPVNVTAEVGNLVEGDTCTVTVEDGDAVNAGSYTATAASVDNSNYALSANPEDHAHAYIIAPKTVELTWSGDAGLVYDGEAVDVKAEVGNLVEGDTCTVTVENGDAVNAGSYTATATSVGNSNYALPANPQDHVHAYIIAPRTVELIWSGDADLVYDGEAVDVTAEVGNLVEGDTCTVTVENGDAVNAGSYTATATSVGNANYVLSANPEDHVHPYSIAPRTVELTWSGDADLVYNGEAVSVKAEVGNLVEGDTCTVTVENGDAVNAGSYDATATSVDNANYVLSANPEDHVHAYIIAPRPVELIWSGNEERVYDGTASSVTANAGNLVEGDECNVTVTGGTERNAGTHRAEAESLDDANYTLPEDVSCAYIIQPKDIKVSWSGNGDRIYDGTASNLTAVAEDLVEGDECGVTVTGGTEKDAGTHIATAALENDNYALSEGVTCTYAILSKEISLSWSGNAERTYDGAASNVTAAAEGLVEGDECGVTVTGGTEKNAGTHTATATSLDNGNYALPEEASCSYTIQPKEISLSWNGNAERIYDGTTSNVTAAAEGLVEGDECAVTVTGGTEKNAGTYTAEATELDNGNYALPEEASCSYTIQPKEISLSWNGNTERIYDGTTSNVTAAAEGLVEGDACAVTVTGGTEKNAGTYTAEATELDNGNYVLPEEASCSYTIQPKEISLSWSGNAERTYDGTASNVTAAVEGLVEGDECTVTVTGGTEKNAGTYRAAAESLDNGNYTLPDDVSCAYTIQPKEINVSWSGNADRTYDGTASNVTASAVGLVEGEQCDVTVTGGTERNAGIHRAVAEIAIGNYVLPEEVSCTYAILPREVSLSWSGNAERTYDGEASNVTAAATGFVEGDACTVTVTGGTEKNAGTHTATAALDNDNYALPEESFCAYTIQPKEISLSWSGNAERTYDGVASNVTAAAVGLVEGDACTVTVTGGTEKNVGTYTATAAALGNGNYVLPKEVSSSYTIQPKEISLSWDGNAERIYDGEASNVTAVAVGLVEGDACTVTVTGGTEKNAGTHTATAAALGNGNYVLPKEVSSSYTIQPKEISLSWSGNAERTYDGVASNVTAAAVGLVEGDACTVTVTGGTEKNVGTYTATAAAFGNGNYVLPKEVSSSYTIQPKEISLSWSGNAERTYDGEASNVTAAATGLVEGDACTVTVTGGTEKNAGTYTATAMELDNGNYALPKEVSSSYTIQPKEVSLSWDGNAERIYDGEASNVTAAAVGLVEGDACTVTVTGGTEKNAGTYTATATELDNGNYALPEEASSSYTIQPKEVSLSWDGNAERIYDGAASNVTAAAAGLVEGDACTVTVTGGTEKNAGTHTATATELDNGNYALPEEASSSYTIQPKEITLSWSGNGARTYDGAASNVTAAAAGLVEGDACTVTVTGGTEKNAGTHTATAAALDNGNYALPEAASSVYTILPREITLGWSGNAERTYDGTASNVTAAAAGLVTGDTCGVTVTGGTEKNAGTHTATAAALDNGNYALPSARSCAYTIRPREAVLSWSGNAERIYDGAASNVAASVANLVAGDACVVTVTGGNGVNAGTHAATAAGLDNGNYVLPPQASCAYTIGKAEQGLNVPKDSYTQTVKKAFTLGASAAGEVTYASSNSRIAKVDASGKVTPLRSGKAVITVEAKATENYNGASRAVEVYVRPSNVASFKAKAGKKRITLTWKKQTGVSGYQIQYSTSKKFTKKTTKTVNVKASAKKYTLKKLASKKRYYVRIRAYKTINRVKYYSPRFRTKKVTVK